MSHYISLSLYVYMQTMFLRTQAYATLTSFSTHQPPMLLE